MGARRPRSFNEYLRAASRRKGLVVATAAIFAVAAWIALQRHPRLYEASAVIEISAVSAKTGETSDVSTRMGTLRERFMSLSRLEALAQEPGISELLRRHERTKQDFAADLQSRLRITSLGAGLVRITSCASDPAIAAAVANQIADGIRAEGSTPPTGPYAAPDTTPFADAKLAVKSSPGATARSSDTDSLRQRAIELSARLRQFEDRAPWLLSLKESPVIVPSVSPASASSSAEAARTQQLTIESLRDRQYLLQQQLADIEPRISTVSRIVEAQKNGSNLSDSPTYAALISRRTELEGQRDNLVNRQELTDKHPRVTAITDQITAINRQIESLRQQDASQAGQSAEARELRSLQSERNRLKLELEVNNRELARRLSAAPAPSLAPAAAHAPSRGQSGSPLAAEYLAVKRNYEEVLTRLGTVESTASAGSPVEPSWTVRDVEAATMPSAPIGPSSWLFVFGAVVSGLIIGTSAAVIIESRGFSTVQDARDVEFYTRLPLLVAIPRTLTAAEHKSRGSRAAILLAIRLVVAVGLTFALAAVFLVTNLFSLIGGS